MDEINDSEVIFSPVKSNRSSSDQRVIQIALTLAVVAVLTLLIFISRRFGGRVSIPEINSGISGGMIFVVGLLSGLHCVGMCGSFIIGYSGTAAESGRPGIYPHILYGAGKTLSYAIFGALFGFVGSLFRITPLISGISISLAGIFLIVYGLSNLKIFSLLKAVRFRQPLILGNFANEKRQRPGRPFFIGFFSGLILGCGPLQVMYVMVAGNGDALEGAKFLALFGLGTLPALIGFGLLAVTLSVRIKRNFVYATGIILIILGSIMLNKGLLKAGFVDGRESVPAACTCHELVDQNSGNPAK